MLRPDLTSADNDSFPPTAPSTSQVAIRRLALEQTAAAELGVLEQLISQSSHNLEQITFTRPVHPVDRAEASVTYKLSISTSVNARGKWTSTILRPSDGCCDALPQRRAYIGPIYSYKRWAGVVHDSTASTLLAAAAGGIALGEVLRTGYEAGVFCDPKILCGAILVTPTLAAVALM